MTTKIPVRIQFWTIPTQFGLVTRWEPSIAKYAVSAHGGGWKFERGKPKVE